MQALTAWQTHYFHSPTKITDEKMQHSLTLQNLGHSMLLAAGKLRNKNNDSLTYPVLHIAAYLLLKSIEISPESTNGDKIRTSVRNLSHLYSNLLQPFFTSTTMEERRDVPAEEYLPHLIARTLTNPLISIFNCTMQETVDKVFAALAENLIPISLEAYETVAEMCISSFKNKDLNFYNKVPSAEYRLCMG